MTKETFYDLEYIIKINEKRIEEYISAYQKVLERFTNIIIIYSAIAIFLVPICQDICFAEVKHWLLLSCFIVFCGLFLISLYNTIRLIMPVEVSYLKSPRSYYDTMRLQYEQTLDIQDHGRDGKIAKLLQASYIDELEEALEMNIRVFTRKSSFYYNALMFALLSAVPFLICLCFHITKKGDKVQQVEIVNSDKFINLQLNQTDSKMSRNTNTTTNTTTNPKPALPTGTSTKLPGIDNAQVIRSSPNIIKENSQHIKKK